MDWFLYDTDFHGEKIKENSRFSFLLSYYLKKYNIFLWRKVFFQTDLMISKFKFWCI